MGDSIVGYAAVFSQASANFAGWIEILEAGCFDQALCEGRNNILCRVDHLLPIGSTNDGNLDVGTDKTGLWYVATPGPEHRWALDDVRSGELDGSSFAFSMQPGGDDRWGLTKSGHLVREIVSVGSLSDVAPVRVGAYPDASVELRGPGRYPCPFCRASHDGACPGRRPATLDWTDAMAELRRRYHAHT